MIERLIEASLARRGMALGGALLIAVFGVLAFRGLPIDAFPDVTSVQIEVVCTVPGLPPQEIEQMVTAPLELAMKGLPDLALTRSVTKFGIAVVTLVFEDGTDLYFARQQVFQRLVEVRERLPRTAEVEMGPVSTAMGEIYQYTLDAPPAPDGEARVGQLTELRTLQDWVVAPLLKEVPGVNAVNSFGGYIRQIQVVADPQKLIEHGLTLDAVAEALEAGNTNVGGGFAERHGEQFIVRGVGALRSVQDIERVPLRLDRPAPLTLGDLARVEDGHAPRQGAALLDGEREVVGGIVMLLKGANSRAVVRAVRERVEAINAGGTLPAGITLKSYYDRADIIGRSIRTVTEALLVGALLVVAVLYLFLRDYRGALVVVLSLPLAGLLAFIIMRTAGMEANLIALGGLAVSIGMIIDATIIQVENVERRLAAAPPGEGRLATVLKGVLEVRKPSIFGEFIIAVTFLPILSLQGMEGKMFAPLALTVAIALFSSLLLSIFVVPALCAVLLRPGRRGEGFLLEGALALYRPALRWVLPRRTRIAAGALLLLAGALLLVPRIGTEFVPVMDEGAFDMDIAMLPGIALPEALAAVGEAGRRLMEFPELVTLVSRTGQTGIALEARGVDKTGFVGILKPRKEWTTARTRKELDAKMREALEGIPGIAFGFSQPIQCRIDELVAGTRSQVILRLFGPDPEALQATAADAAAVLAGIPGTVDLVLEQTAGQPVMTVTVDPEAAAHFGLTVRDILGTLEAAVGGRTATILYAMGRPTEVVLRYPEERRAGEEDLRNILLLNARGHRVPMGQVARVETVEGPAQISRENGRRFLGIELNIAGRDIGGYVAEASRTLRERVPLPPGAFTAWGGQFENQQRAMRRLRVIVPLAVGLILLLLTLAFRSVRLALLVLATLPLSLIGGIVGLHLSGLYLSVPASIGFIALFGVAVLNGLVLVSRGRDLSEGGLAPEEAAEAAGLSRLRPVLMTASITIFSLLPMLFATGPGSEIQKPLAVVMICGLATSTLLTLLVLPALYPWFASKNGAGKGSVGVTG